MTLGHVIKTINCSKVKAKVNIVINSLKFANDASRQRFSVWVKRQGKSNRGTLFAPAAENTCNFNEVVSHSVTLYKDKTTGTFKRKKFQVIVLCLAPGTKTEPQEYGWCEIDVSHKKEMSLIPLRSIHYVDAHIQLAVEIDYSLD